MWLSTPFSPILLVRQGRAALALFPIISNPATSGVPKLTYTVAEAFYGAGLVAALLLWALGMWWAVIGLATFLRQLSKGHLSFNMGETIFSLPRLSQSTRSNPPLALQDGGASPFPWPRSQS